MERDPLEKGRHGETVSREAARARHSRGTFEAVRIEPKNVVSIVLLAGLGLLGLWAYAYVLTTTQLREVRVGARAIGYARGGRLPTDAEVEAQLRSLAEARDVVLRDVSVASHDEGGLGPIAGRVPALGGVLGGTTRVYEIRAQGTARAFGFSREEPIEVELPLRGETHVIDPRGGGGARDLRLELRRQGLEPEELGSPR